MPLIDITNPAIIKFLIENYEKENRLRLNWIHKHGEKVHQAATLNRQPKNYFELDVLAANMAAGMATITRDHKVAGYNRRKEPIRDAIFIPDTNNLRHGHSIVEVGLGDAQDDPRLKRSDHDLAIDPIMRPVEPKIAEIIYKSKPEYGRVQYIEKRNKIWPEKKYYFSECSSWDYGWRMKDSGLHQKPEYGRCYHLTSAMRSRVGPQPDPAYYKSSDPPTSMKCTN